MLGNPHSLGGKGIATSYFRGSLKILFKMLANILDAVRYLARG